MGVGYRAVGWNRQKRVYDGWLAAGVLLYLAVFAAASLVLTPDATPETVVIRALGSGAFVLLHVVLCIGPLVRLRPRLAPLLYNRRHLGVTMFALALGHGLFALLQFHGFGIVDPLTSLLTGGGGLGTADGFPFQTLGLAALAILFLMAATSHDFWLANLTAPVWKTLHMGVYAAYLMLLGHVLLGTWWVEGGVATQVALSGGAALVAGLHLAAGLGERRHDRERALGSAPVEVARLGELVDGRGIARTVAGERVALFRDGSRLFALSNVCRHQNGPLGEGRVRDGCVVCPWHGYEYRAADGCAPPPFTESVPTFRVLLDGDRVLVDPRPIAPGLCTEPATIPKELR